MAKRKIYIDRDGNVKALCDNTIDNSNLGERTIKRAADVEFNNEKKVWEIILPDGEVIGSHTRRDEAIKLEIELMSNRLREELVS